LSEPEQGSIVDLERAMPAMEKKRKKNIAAKGAILLLLLLRSISTEI